MTNVLKISICTSFFIFFLGGCASSYHFSSKNPSLLVENESVKALSEKDLAYWEHVSKKEFDVSYAYELPHLRYLKPLEWYKNFHAPNRQYFTMEQYAITFVDSHRAIIKHRYNDKDGNHLELEDRWVLVGNEWFHYFEFSKLPLDTPIF